MHLLIGATGFMGTEIAQRFSKTGLPARALVHNPASGERLPAEIERVSGDVSDAASLDRALEGVDEVFLLTPTVQMQLEWEEAVIAAAARNGVRHVLLCSAKGADPESPISFRRAHGLAEEALKRSGIGYTILRPTMFMQNLLRTASAVGTQGVLLFPVDSPVTYVDLRDVADIAVTLLAGDHHRGETHEPTGSRAVDCAEIATLLSRELGRDVRFQHVDLTLMLGGQPAGDVNTYLIEGMAAELEFWRRGDGERRTDTIQRILGRSPRTIEGFVVDYRDAFAAPATV